MAELARFLIEQRIAFMMESAARASVAPFHVRAS